MNRLLFHRHHPLVALLLANLLGWCLTRTLVFTNLDSYGDMLENFAWGQGFTWGTHKHPPLQAWVVGAWFRVLPASEPAYWLLSGVNVLMGLWALAVWVRALDLGRDADVAAVGLAMLMLPFSTLASKFNANSVLLAIWPWMAVAFWQAVHTSGGKRWAWSVALGVFCALGMLAKYYSGVWMLAICIASVLHAQGRRWWFTPMPWLALIAAGTVLAPHVLWLRDHHWLPLHYVQEQGDGHVHGEQLWRFVASCAIFSVLPWLIVVVMQWRHLAFDPTDGVAASVSFKRRVGQGLRAISLPFIPQNAQDLLWWLAALPLLITLAFGASGFVELSSPWAIPLVFPYPLLWLRAMKPAAVAQLSRWFRRWFWLWLLLPLLSAISLWHDAQTGIDGPTPPRAAAAWRIHALWQQTHPGVALAWVGGQWAESAVLSFYVDAHIRTVPGTPSDVAAQALDLPADLPQQPGLLLCAMGWADEPESEAGQVCKKDVQTWLKHQAWPTAGLAGQTVEAQRAVSWRFSKPRVYRYQVWFVDQDLRKTALALL